MTYKQKYLLTLGVIKVALFTLCLVALVNIFVGFFEKPVIQSPRGTAYAKEVEYVEVYTKPKTIEDDIRLVFGEYANQAFDLLECENKTLDPLATNDNTKWGGVGVDRGLFQINDHWQGFRHTGKAQQFLYDPEINIRVAWRIFEDDGYSFKKWTCGRNN